MKCFYHSADLDGACSGAIIKNEFPDCEMIGINYGEGFPWKTIEDGEVVYMVDFSLSPYQDMILLNSRCKLTWVDHHKTALEAEAGYIFPAATAISLKIDGIRRVGIGACSLVWELFYGNQGPTPLAVYYLAKHDVWDHTDPRTLLFQYGLRLEKNTAPDAVIWKSLLNSNPDADHLISSIIKQGNIALRYEDQSNEMYAKACYFITEFEGYECIAINKQITNSKLFDSVWDPTKYDIMIAFGWRKGNWIISLYTTHESIDVSKIAKYHGGGGHKQAAGFTTVLLPFKLGGLNDQKSKSS